ncbi:low molecular weight phosphotyrosine protein phosphatase [Marinobacter panjinensis]|uniref:protein-tyrosine-phosphatase n=1 Tax=Marinobacter panjinensis TaxID=2576384 RepID=A0A4U6R0X9_9GAMM|nr:low molecular weight protein-tyrosine-phosphatase [Marinobacter panjinensis]MCR8914050.1 low molecular weight phosphotyrosine protein phosphatase [Marinobacter panjinensis]TKV67324.1 low molecular weight phosphotyrosine protein phosphatase [Marinobacter panjinensis]
MTAPVKVLFVCLGNICRSPSAEGVFRKVVQQAGLEDRITIDSCGTGGWHVGKAPDSRAIAAARTRGIDIGHLRARQFCSDDLDQYDYVLVMDRQNLADVRDVWRQNGGTEPLLFLQFGGSEHDEVPDPYYGGDQGFEHVLDLINEASEGLLRHIREQAA